MNYLANNIKYLRYINQLTQAVLADKLQIKRSLIGAYEEGRATPKIAVMQLLARQFNLSLDELISRNLEAKGMPQSIVKEKDLQILSVVVDRDNEEMIPIVPVKASAGYLNGFADPEFIEQLPRFSMPVPELTTGKTYRVFQIKGDSMLPVLPGSYLFCEFVESLTDLKDGEACVLITKDEGLVYKRIYLRQSGRLLLKSDNTEYEPYEVDGASVLEIWKAKGVLSFDLPNPEQIENKKISDTLSELKDEIRKLRNK